MTAVAIVVATSCLILVQALHSVTRFERDQERQKLLSRKHHLDSFHNPKKRKVGNVGHKSPENNALVKAGVSPDLDAISNNDVTMDSSLKAFQDDPGLSIHGTNDAFKFKN
jgi:hypothetical protein